MSGEVVTGIFRRRSPAGKTLWLRMVVSLIAEQNGRIHKILVVATAVSERREEFLRLHQRLGSLDEFAVTIEHSVDGQLLSASQSTWPSRSLRVSTRRPEPERRIAERFFRGRLKLSGLVRNSFVRMPVFTLHVFVL